MGTVERAHRGYVAKKSMAYFALTPSRAPLAHFTFSAAAFLTGTTMTPSSGSPKLE